MRFFRSIIKSALLLFIVLTSLVVFLFTTTPGLYITVKTVSFFIPGKLIITGLDGRLIDKFSIKDFSYTNSDFQITGHKAFINWHFTELLHKRLTIEKFAIDDLSFILKPTTTSTSEKPGFPKLPINITLENAEIKTFNLSVHGYNQQLSSLKLSTHLNTEQWELNYLDFILKDHYFKFMGYTQTQFPYQLSLVVQAKPLFLPLLEGHLSLKGNFYRYQWQGRFKQPFVGQVEGYAIDGKTVYNSLDWKNFNWLLKDKKSLIIDNGQLLIKGIWPNLLINLNTDMSTPIATHLQTSAQIQPNLSELTTQVTSEVGELNFKAQYAPTHFPHFSGQLLSKLKKNDLIPKELDEVTLESKFKGNSLEDLRIDSEINARYLENKLQIGLNYFKQKMSGQLNLGPNQVALELNLPELNLSAINLKQQVNGQMLLNVNSLSFLKNFDPTITQIDGQLQAKLSIKGALNQPILIGDMNLTHGILTSSQLGIDLNPIELSLHSQNQKWQAQGKITSKANSLSLTGQGEFSPLVKGIINVSGQNFPLINSNEYSINVTPNLAFEFSPSLSKLQGNILIPEALIKPQTFTNSVTLSDDAVFIDEQKKPDNPLNLTTDVQITLGDKVKLAVQGLEGELIGGLRLRQHGNNPLMAEGELNVKNGYYKAYGQNLIIEQGQLIFTGGIISNPGIGVKAIRQFNNTDNSFSGSNRLFDFNPSNMQNLDFGTKTTVGIEVSGRLNSPKVQLFSTPPTLSQADILSMLILGKPANQANKSGAQLLLTAVSALNLKSGTGGTRLLSQLKETLGVDIDLQNNTHFNQKTNQSTDNTSVVVGKSLSKRLYLSYNVGLSQSDSNVLTLKYLLNKFFILQVNASTSGSGIDILYTRQKG